MDIELRIRNHFLDSIETKKNALEELIIPIKHAANCISRSLLNEGRFSVAATVVLQATHNIFRQSY